MNLFRKNYKWLNTRYWAIVVLKRMFISRQCVTYSLWSHFYIVLCLCGTVQISILSIRKRLVFLILFDFALIKLNEMYCVQFCPM